MPPATSTLHSQLHEILRGPALKALPEPVKLASGAWSSHFIDGKEALAKWSDLHVACQAIYEAVSDAEHSFEAVGGLTMGADAIAVGVAAVSDTSWFSVRKELKKRGTNRLIEGTQIGPGWKVLLVDDVVTTGGSIVKAYDAIAQTGAEIVAAVTLVDRGDSARMYFGNLGVDYLPMATYQDLGIGPVRHPLSEFLGMTVSVDPGGGSEPHFHDRYWDWDGPECQAVFRVRDLRRTEGWLTPLCMEFVEEWARGHLSELRRAWESVQAGKMPSPIEPLE